MNTDMNQYLIFRLRIGMLINYCKKNDSLYLEMFVLGWLARHLCLPSTFLVAWAGVKFGINFTSVSLSGNKIARGEAECYLPLNLTRVKFVPEISRLTVLLKINTIASLLFI